MAETEKHQLQDHPQSPEMPSFSLRIWPPSQKTRDVVIKHLTDTLSSPSSFTNRYGTFPLEEAVATAKVIEEDSFRAAAVSGVEDDACRGIEILQVYSKEISKRLLEMVKNQARKQQDGSVSSEENIPS
ncbi:hypothetical protein JCGZ_12470 [Jatropha curcas]|uniref:WPP domain-containing protein n=1 Tax=Jatropha curcas TaxID=180498 RepID=A0A067KJJ7_JATCU|nr:MFP1 attachment factor 1 [Jatropha curcas]KDP32009.1 hypothetical protein JCGZ_12470 [Jatropha curcas]